MSTLLFNMIIFIALTIFVILARISIRRFDRYIKKLDALLRKEGFPPIGDERKNSK